jgi:hypothetical protein
LNSMENGLPVESILSALKKANDCAGPNGGAAVDLERSALHVWHWRMARSQRTQKVQSDIYFDQKSIKSVEKVGLLSLQSVRHSYIRKPIAVP